MILNNDMGFIYGMVRSENNWIRFIIGLRDYHEVLALGSSTQRRADDDQGLHAISGNSRDSWKTCDLSNQSPHALCSSS